MPHIIITGGSSGIGLEIARLYVAGGCHVTLIARQTELLQSAVTDLSGAGKSDLATVFAVSADVSDEEAVQSAIALAVERNGPCDILVASAGRVDPQDFIGQPSATFTDEIFVNFFGAVHVVRAVLPGMQQRGRGKIMLISSGAALLGIPGYAAYCASKSALSAFAEALRAEIVQSGVKIGVSFPPDTQTAQLERELPLRPKMARYLMSAVSPWAADKVARKIVDGINKGRSQVHFGFSLTMLSWFGPFIKPVLYWRLRRMAA